ncbi:hypothetical protein CLORY_23430 [Clostridium oryzae]|uniref:Uncharacterized protein n=1 Tax=Clostridium oryzae TaxID=1450648 RepID=A0A1V4IN42_9CLOT|nr:hypothetical protein CLORY_23430 [Clostridium oryzae]
MGRVLDFGYLKRAGLVRNCDGKFYEHGPGAYCLKLSIRQYGFVAVKILGDKS